MYAISTNQVKETLMGTQNTIVSWIALIIALIAVVLAWVAFNRTGVDIEAIIREEAEQRAAELRIDFEELERDLRNSTSDQLQEAADEVDTATTTE